LDHTVPVEAREPQLPLPGAVMSPPPTQHSTSHQSTLHHPPQPQPSDHVEVRGAESSSIPQGSRFYHSRNPSWRYSQDTALHSACMEGDLSAVKRLIKQSPEAVSALAADGDLPIHRAVASSSDDALEIVKELLAAAPNHINNQGMEGEYPLHIASACARSVMMVHYLISLQPETALKTNSRGDLPIHRACMNRGPDRDSIVKALLDLEPDCVKEAGAQGHLPLHRACFCSTLGSVKQLIGRHPDALRKPDAKGQVPLFKC